MAGEHLQWPVVLALGNAVQPRAGTYVVYVTSTHLQQERLDFMAADLAAFKVPQYAPAMQSV